MLNGLEISPDSRSVITRSADSTVRLWDLDVDAIAQRARGLHAEKAELVKLRYFVGMTIPQAAEALGISKAKADRHWKYARAWLLRHLRGGDV